MYDRIGHCHCWPNILNISSLVSTSTSSRIFWINLLMQHLSRMLFKVFISITLVLSMRLSWNENRSAGGNIGRGSKSGSGGSSGPVGVQAGSYMRMTQRNNHANISELLDNLLQGYDNSIRPDFGGKHFTQNTSMIFTWSKYFI